MKELFKKYGFIFIFGLWFFFFFIFCGFGHEIKINRTFVIETKEKIIDGNSVIYNFNDKDYTTMDLFNSLNDDEKVSFLRTLIEKEAIRNYELDNETKKLISANIANLKQQYSDEQLLSEVNRLGFKSINEYLEQSFKARNKLKEYILKHKADYYKNDDGSKIISHILISVKDVTSSEEDGVKKHKLNPTDEEKEKLAKVLEELKTKDFATVASTYSDDAGSATNGGKLGYTNDVLNERYVPEFRKAVSELKEKDEVSKVIESQFGYHIIKVDSINFDDFLNEASFIKNIEQNDPNINKKMLKEYMDNNKIEVKDEKLKDLLQKALEVE